MSIYNKIRIEFKPFVDETGEILAELEDRVDALSRYAGSIDAHFEEGYVIVYGVRPSRIRCIRNRLPANTIYEGIDMDMDRIELARIRRDGRRTSEMNDSFMKTFGDEAKEHKLPIFRGFCIGLVWLSARLRYFCH